MAFRAFVGSNRRFLFAILVSASSHWLQSQPPDSCCGVVGSNPECIEVEKSDLMLTGFTPPECSISLEGPETDPPVSSALVHVFGEPGQGSIECNLQRPFLFGGAVVISERMSSTFHLAQFDIAFVSRPKKLLPF